MSKTLSAPSEETPSSEAPKTKSRVERLNIPTELITFHDLIEKMSTVEMDDDGHLGDQVSADEKLKHLLREHANSLDEAARKELEEKVIQYEKAVNDEKTAKQAYVKEQNALSGDLHGPLTKAVGGLRGTLSVLGEMPKDGDINHHPAVIAFSNLQQYTDLKEKVAHYTALEDEFGKLDVESETADGERKAEINARMTEIEADEDYSNGRVNKSAFEALKNAEGEQYSDEDARKAEGMYDQLDKLYRQIGKIRSLGGKTSSEAHEKVAIQEYKKKFTGDLAILFDPTALPAQLDFSKDEMSLKNLKKTINIIATHPLFKNLDTIISEMEELELSDEETMEKIKNLKVSSEQKAEIRISTETELRKIAQDAGIDLDKEEVSLGDEYAEIADEANDEVDKRSETLRQEITSNIQTIGSNIDIFEKKALEELEKTATYTLLHPFLELISDDSETDYYFSPTKEIAGVFRTFGKDAKYTNTIMGYDASEKMNADHADKAKKIVSNTADKIERSERSAGMDAVTDLMDQLDPRVSDRSEYMNSKENTLNAVQNLTTQAENILRMANFLRTMMVGLDTSLELNGKDIETEEQNIRDIQLKINEELKSKKKLLIRKKREKHKPGAVLDKDLEREIAELEQEVQSLDAISRDEGKPHRLRKNKVKFERRKKNYLEQRGSIEQARSLVANFMIKIMLNLANNQNGQLPHLARIEHLSEDLESFKQFEESRPKKDDKPDYSFKPKYMKGDDLVDLESSVSIKEAATEDDTEAVDASELVKTLYLYKIIQGEAPVRIESFA